MLFQGILLQQDVVFTKPSKKICPCNEQVSEEPLSSLKGGEAIGNRKNLRGTPIKKSEKGKRLLSLRTKGSQWIP